MSIFLNRLTLVCLATFLSFVLIGCSSDDDRANNVSDCVDGEAGCVCFANDTCLVGLICSSGTCIDADGTLSTTWNPNANNKVSALAVSGSTVYAGGGLHQHRR